MRKPPDLSTRSNGIVQAPSSPVFSRRNSNPTGTLTFAAAGSQPLYQAPGSVTVLWILFQVQQAVTVQLFKNGEALSASYQLNAGAIVRYAGLLLLGNEVLSLSVSAACTVTYELAWVKEHDERLITCDTVISNPSSGGTTNDNVVQWGGATVAAALADAPAGTEIAPVVRDIFRKKTTIETTTPLAAGATFTGAWHDSELDGTACVMVYSLSNVAAGGAAASFTIQVTEDTTNAGLIQSAASSASNPAVGAGTVGRAFATIKARFWRVVYTNGATPQTTFELTSCAFNAPWIPANVISMAGNNGNFGEQVPTVFTMQAGTRLAVFGDGNGNSSMNFTGPDTGLVNAPPVFPLLFNGATWDRPRSNASVATGDTGAKVATFNGATQTNFDAVGAYITVLLGAVTGTTPTLTMQLQWSPDGGTTWLNLGPASATLTASSQIGVLGIYATNFSQTPGATPANLTTGANVSTFINAPLPRTWRIVYTIAGTTPSFTISSVQVNYIRG